MKKSVEDWKEEIEHYLRANEVFGNIVYCFRDRSLKEHLGLYNVPHEGEYYTELLVEEKDGEIALTHKNSPIFVYGEYKKFSREMTQTPLRIKGKLKCLRSVSDFTKQIKDFYGAREVVFTPSGREDIDVMNLGGRPFILKIKEPAKNLLHNKFNLDLYPEIELNNLRRVSRTAQDSILKGEQEKSKLYRCVLSCPQKLEMQREYKIKQKTPLRVLHRRANIVREREVNIIKVEEKAEGGLWKYTVDLKATAGTYIKEFVSGDLGRTTPSLSSDGNLVELETLDVLKVEGISIPEEIIY
ncbi:putative tRNA pseudouridine synthase Pus10 [Nosema granulosis]|uniref:tRNA pseudouridine(55) synthase n=1 Tax=Nosema granulosis TaxID=83296 RepID=A0A9P6KY52_9MICR|nr:putative tRNA pseudouridine synthase Pus10 [Nosema granulosis]